MWGSLSTCYTLSKPRQFPVTTFGCDMSKAALEYGLKAGIFDGTAALDLNNLTASQKELVREKCKTANIMTFNSFVYINDGVFEQVMEWFAEGTEPGMLLLGLIYPYDGVERMRSWKKLLLEKFEFFDTVPAANRTLDKQESINYGTEFGCWERSYYDFWYLTRKV